MYSDFEKLNYLSTLSSTFKDSAATTCIKSGWCSRLSRQSHTLGVPGLNPGLDILLGYVFGDQVYYGVILTGPQGYIFNLFSLENRFN